MRLAIISDIHANFTALSALDEVLHQADLTVCLGDMTGYYCQPNEVCDSLRHSGALCLRGNHDHYALTETPERVPESVKWGVEFTRQHLSAENRAWLETLSPMKTEIFGGFSALLVHGAPWDALEAYLYADNPRLVELERLNYDLVAFGQTHHALLRDGRPILLNPGAVGQSRDGTAEACAALLDTETRAVELIRRRYDPQPVMALARGRGAGDWITKHLV
ncbi:MAG: metallophosphoesterase family protein [Chloroflexi bacterium]|nr:metallophosphoesterase family protein [Chloroflexota bacterium]